MSDDRRRLPGQSAAALGRMATTPQRGARASGTLGGDGVGTDASGQTEPEKPHRWRKFASVTSLSRWTLAPHRLIVCGLVAGAIGYWGTGYAYVPLSTAEPEIWTNSPSSTSASDGTDKQLVSENRQLRTRLDRLMPRGFYIVIDQSQNRLYLKQQDRVFLTAVCSSGSGMVLVDKDATRRWIFDTPRGRFKVSSKLRNPVWRKPDWAFVEEDVPVPEDPAERFEYGSLGEYALYLGQGYMIHGTLYERLLGQSVTHGCIRLGRDDLRTVYRLVPVGTPVFIY